MIIAIPGGMSGVMIAAVATSTELNAFENPRF